MSNDITGMEDIELALDQFTAELTEGIWKAVEDTTKDTVQDTKQHIRDHNAIRTGRLLRSYHAEFDEPEEGILEGASVTDVPYSKFLEHGTSRMRPRSHQLPSFEKNKGKLVRRLKAL